MGFTQAQAEDLAQETFTRAWQHLGQYDAQKAEFSTWLATWQFVCAGIAAVQWYCPALAHRLCARPLGGIVSHPLREYAADAAARGYLVCR
ncbi:sigma factor [Thiothrix lacustris]|uniref:sigma factor n=1 Tax=Thiothrix lacustris TaxID=525917 RepID=UPI00355826BE